MGDTIIFMSAYGTTKYSKSRLVFKKKPKLGTLLNKHHLTYILMGNKLISPKGALKLCAEYDYVKQSTSFSFSPINGYQYFGEENMMPSNDKISEIIYNNVSSFFFEMTGKKFVPEDYSFIHNTLVLSNKINDVSDYFCN